MQVVILDERTDLDALSSAYGITLIERNTLIVLSNVVPATARLVLNRFKSKFEGKIINREQLKNVEKVFLVDSNYLNEIREFLEMGIPIEVYDHHPILERHPSVKYHVEQLGAATTLVVERIIEEKIHIDSDDATILALGIYEDTGSFTYNMTTPRDMKAASFLLEKGADLNFIRYVVEEKIDEDLARIIEQLIENIHTVVTGDKRIILTYAVYDRYIQDVSSVFHMIKPFEEADAVFAAVNFSGKITLIGRSKTKEIDAGKILSFFGGGGHYAAASATIRGITTNDVLRYLEEILLIEGFSDLTIGQIMKKSFHTVEINLLLNQVPLKLLEEPMIVVVDDNGKFQGVIFSKVIKEALNHGVKGAKVRDFVIDELVVFSPDTGIFQAERELSKFSQDYFPVVKDGYPVGVVSRFDILKAAHGRIFDAEKEVFISRQRISPKKSDFRRHLRRYLPEDVLSELRFIGEVSKELGFRAFLVGGVVRDIVLGKKNLDIDVIIEGDAVKLIKEYARRRGYSFHVFEEFMTGQVKLPNGLKIDFATARKETYDYPGAYPKVERATIKEDLFRRDFTINTLAIEITEGSFGILLDFFNGLRDIKDRVIRILHQLSFIEDPIRILRALRFAGRLSFRLGKTTEKLLKAAIEQNLLQTAPAGRINLELELTFSEERVVDILILMSEYKVLHQLIPEYFFDERREEILVKVRDLIVSFELFLDIEVDKNSLYLLSLMYHLPLEISYQFLEKYFFLKSKQIFKEFFDKKEILSSVPEKNSRLYKLIRHLKKEVVIFMCAISEVDLSERIIEILKKEKEKGYIISGKDLKELGLKPSPLFGRIIEDVFLKFLDGQIKNRNEAIEYVKSKYLSSTEKLQTER